MRKRKYYKLKDFEIESEDYSWNLYDNDDVENNHKEISINVLSNSRNQKIPNDLILIIENLANDVLRKNHLHIKQVVLMARIVLSIVENVGSSLEVEIYMGMKDLSDLSDNYRKFVVECQSKSFASLKQYFFGELEKLMFG